jgi:nitrate reductase gamma subunit
MSTEIQEAVFVVVCGTLVMIGISMLSVMRLLRASLRDITSLVEEYQARLRGTDKI